MIRQNEIGKTFTIYSGCELTGISTIVMKMRKPDGTEVDWTPDSIGADSFTYKTVSGDLDQVGKYKLLETQYTFVNGDYFRGCEDEFKVYE